LSTTTSPIIQHSHHVLVAAGCPQQHHPLHNTVDRYQWLQAIHNNVTHYTTLPAGVSGCRMSTAMSPSTEHCQQVSVAAGCPQQHSP
jgi:hypothetical protein